MSTVYNPQGGVPSPTVAGQVQSLILSSTNTGPIQVTLTAPSSWNDQDTVEIVGHKVNTNANGVWTVTKITSSIWTLNGSTGNGVGGNTGTAQDYSLLPMLTIPGDGDLASAGSINPAIEGNGNLGPFLYRLSGKYRLYSEQFVVFGTTTGTPPNWSTTSTASTTYINCTGASALLGPDISVSSGDIVEVAACFQGGTGGTGFPMFCTIGGSFNGGAYTSFGFPEIYSIGINNYDISRTIVGAITIFFPETMNLSIMTRATVSGANVWNMIGGASIMIKQYRPN